MGKNKPVVLIVEDDRINQLYISSVLKKDFETISAYSSEQAFEIVKNFKPDYQFDIVLMDISLSGGMDGLELTKIIRASDKYSNVPVIAMTGHVSLQDRKNCFDAGCNEFLSKPFEDHDVLEKIKMFI